MKQISRNLFPNVGGVHTPHQLSSGVKNAITNETAQNEKCDESLNAKEGKCLRITDVFYELEG